MANQPLFYNQTQTQRRITSIHRAPKLSEGIYLVKRKGMKSPVYDHYGFAVSGKYLKSFNLSGDTAKVIHKDDTGVIQNDFAPFSWQIVHRMPENEIPLAIIRTKMTLSKED